MYRMVVLDLDGTALNPQGELSPRVQAAVARTLAAGVAVTVATGRRWRSALPAVRGLGVRVPVILHNGAVVAEPRLGLPLAEHGLAPERALAAAEFLAAQGCAPCFSCHAPLPPRPELLYTKRPASTAAAYFLEQWPDDARQVASLAEASQLGPLRVFALDRSDRMEAAARPAHLGAGLEQMVAPDIPGHMLVEFRAAGVNKATGVAWLASRLGIASSDVIAFGDNMNDQEMLAWAGLGVAMGNAVPEIRSMADLVAPANAEDGVAAVLERYILGEVA